MDRIWILILMSVAYADDVPDGTLSYLNTVPVLNTSQNFHSSPSHNQDHSTTLTLPGFEAGHYLFPDISELPLQQNYPLDPILNLEVPIEEDVSDFQARILPVNDEVITIIEENKEYIIPEGFLMKKNATVIEETNRQLENHNDSVKDGTTNLSRGKKYMNYDSKRSTVNFRRYGLPANRPNRKNTLKYNQLDQYTTKKFSYGAIHKSRQISSERYGQSKRYISTRRVTKNRQVALSVNIALNLENNVVKNSASSILQKFGTHFEGGLKINNPPLASLIATSRSFKDLFLQKYLRRRILAKKILAEVLTG